MRKCAPKLKILEKVAIPDDLKAYVSGIQHLIDEDAEEIKIESDDLIQSQTAYGGLLEEEGREFGITYFPEHEENGVRHKWELIFTKDAVSEISQGKKGFLELWSCTAPECHCRFQVEDETCFYCDYEEIES